MKIRFTFRSDEYTLPSPENLFEFTRAVHKNFCDNPVETYKDLEKHILPMGQLQNGLFFSFKSSPNRVINKYAKLAKDNSLKLEMSWPINSMVRIDFETESKASQHQHCCKSFTISFRRFLPIPNYERSPSLVPTEFY